MKMMNKLQVLLTALISVLVACSIAATAKATVHTVITTECGQYFGWQSLGKGSTSTVNSLPKYLFV
jgi:ABC-type glycerol-3-phosphate transport system substrate-binding protein